MRRFFYILLLIIFLVMVSVTRWALRPISADLDVFSITVIKDSEVQFREVPAYAMLHEVLTEDDLTNVDLAKINLQYILHHHDIITLPIFSDIPCISINTSLLDELTSLNGIGTATAQKIIDYRFDNGLFQTLEDIMLVKGIKTAVFNKIKDNICL